MAISQNQVTSTGLREQIITVKLLISSLIIQISNKSNLRFAVKFLDGVDRTIDV